MLYGGAASAELECMNEALGVCAPVTPSVPARGGRVKLWDEIQSDPIQQYPFHPCAHAPCVRADPAGADTMLTQGSLF
jgi:hypothetical protein